MWLGLELLLLLAIFISRGLLRRLAPGPEHGPGDRSGEV